MNGRTARAGVPDLVAFDLHGLAAEGFELFRRTGEEAERNRAVLRVSRDEAVLAPVRDRELAAACNLAGI